MKFRQMYFALLTVMLTIFLVNIFFIACSSDDESTSESAATPTPVTGNLTILGELFSANAAT